MDKELELYYSNRIALFAEVGWKELVEDVTAMKAATDTVSGISTAEELNFRRGELSMMNWILSLESMSHNALEELKNETA